MAAISPFSSIENHKSLKTGRNRAVWRHVSQLGVISS